LSSRRRNAFQVELFCFVLGAPLINKTLVALGAGYRHLLFVMENMGRLAGSNDCRYAKFAADDRGMRGAAAVIGYDRRGALS
jgi:hypothetical protein